MFNSNIIGQLNLTFLTNKNEQVKNKAGSDKIAKKY